MMQHQKNKKIGGDVVSGIANVAEKIGIPLKNLHLPGHKFTGE